MNHSEYLGNSQATDWTLSTLHVIIVTNSMRKSDNTAYLMDVSNFTYLVDFDYNNLHVTMLKSFIL